VIAYFVIAKTAIARGLSVVTFAFAFVEAFGASSEKKVGTLAVVGKGLVVWTVTKVALCLVLGEIVVATTSAAMRALQHFLTTMTALDRIFP